MFRWLWYKIPQHTRASNPTTIMAHQAQARTTIALFLTHTKRKICRISSMHKIRVNQIRFYAVCNFLPSRSFNQQHIKRVPDTTLQHNIYVWSVFNSIYISVFNTIYISLQRNIYQPSTQYILIISHELIKCTLGLIQLPYERTPCTRIKSKIRVLHFHQAI